MLDGIPQLTPDLSTLSQTHGFIDHLNHLNFHLMPLAQAAADQMWAGVQKFFKNFIESGQVWAMIAGMILGWWLRDVLP